VVSAEAELDFEKGYRSNLDGTRALLEAVRHAGGGYRPRIVYSSSMAVFGAPFPESIPTIFHLTPLTSYGTAKAIGELLLADYTRRGFCDGIGLRLPAICVRPGTPNKAASGFFSRSSASRSPARKRFSVADMVRHTHASPRAAVGFLIHAAEFRATRSDRASTFRCRESSCTVGEQILALARIAGKRVAGRIRRVPDPLTERIVAGWPDQADAQRACELGFVAEDSFDEIIRVHIEDELNGHFRGVMRFADIGSSFRVPERSEGARNP